MRALCALLLWSGVSRADPPPPVAPVPAAPAVGAAVAPGPWAIDLPADAIRGGQQLHLDPVFVLGVQEGLELMYRRRYEAAREHFSVLERDFPGTGIRAVADVLVWQALMMENFDFRFDKQYWNSTRAAKKEIESALAKAGNEAWEHLLMASLLGIESIHTMRQGGYLGALQLAFQAMDHIEKCRAAAPAYVDLELADGMYNYWRSAITLNSKVLPDFGDHRVKGLAQMASVENTGIFVRPMATLSLAFSWMEEGDLEKAAAATEKNRKAYPDSVINNLVSAMVLVSMRRYDQALEILDRVSATDPTNVRVHYWKGLAYLKDNQLAAATRELETYLSFPLETDQRSYGHYRLGQVYSRAKDYAKAMDQYKAAVKLDGNKGAKTAISALEERKKAGDLTF